MIASRLSTATAKLVSAKTSNFITRKRTMAAFTETSNASSNSSSSPALKLREKLQLHKAARSGASSPTTVTMSTTPVETNTNVQILGHRGAIYKAVENTLEAFQSCLELDGCHGVELDVFLLKDGSLVVFHGTGGDVTPGLLDQYCESKHDASSILDLTLPQVQDLSFVQESDHLVAPEEVTATARIPTLQEVLELFRRYPTKRLALELKGTGTVEPTVKLVQDMGMEHQVIFSSFDHSRIHRVAEMNPSLRTAALFKAQVPEEFLELAEKARADEIHLRYDTCSVDRVQAAHQHGFKVMAWFRGPKAMQQDLSDTYVDISNEVSVYKMVMQTGVDAIICNRPHCAVELIRSEERGHEAAAASFDEMEAEQPLETPGETRMPIAVSAN